MDQAAELQKLLDYERRLVANLRAKALVDADIIRVAENEIFRLQRAYQSEVAHHQVTIGERNALRAAS